MTREDINDIINAICPNDEDYEKHDDIAHREQGGAVKEADCPLHILVSEVVRDEA